jgi:hypothetical protein
MTRQSTAPLTHTSLQASNRQARETARSATEGLLDLNAPYQRGSVWTLDQRIALVRSWLLGIPVPAVLVNNRCTDLWRRANGSSPLDTGKGMWACVDGKQRIESAIAWFEGDFAVPASWFEADRVETVEETEDGPYVRYSGLTQAGQRIFVNRAFLPVIEAQVATVEDEADLYLLINMGGTAQTETDLANAAAHANPM